MKKVNKKKSIPELLAQPVEVTLSTLFLWALNGAICGAALAVIWIMFALVA